MTVGAAVVAAGAVVVAGIVASGDGVGWADVGLGSAAACVVGVCASALEGVNDAAGVVSSTVWIESPQPGRAIRTSRPMTANSTERNLTPPPDRWGAG
jgi:hypothetical protein